MSRISERITHFAARPNAVMYLLVFAILDALFLPVPPDVLLIPLAIIQPQRAFFYATIATAGSVLGGFLGYAIGYVAYATAGLWALDFYGLTEGFAAIQSWYHNYDVYVVAMAGFSPLPYKIAAIFSGFMATDITGFLTASILSRGARFFIIAWLLWRYGPSFKGWIETNFYPFTMVASVFMMLGIVLLQYLMQG